MRYFNSLANAISYSKRTIKPTVIMLGENRYIVCSFKAADKLIKQGYEIAKY